MPSLNQLGDSDSVENKYVDRVVLYVEGPDDQSIFSFYLLREYAQKIEIKTPSEVGGGGNFVIDRVQRERAVNSKVFGIVDGDVLLGKGCLAPYKDAFGSPMWIQKAEHDGIYFFPCWEMENLLYSKRVLPQTIFDLQPLKKFPRRTLRSVENGIIREAFRLSELAALNLALWETSNPTIRAETRTEIPDRHTLDRENKNYISTLKDPHEIMARYAKWQKFFRTLLPENCDRDIIYQQFVSRVDGKALGIMLQRRFGLQRDIRTLLARNFSSNDEAMQFIHQLIRLLADSLD